MPVKEDYVQHDASGAELKACSAVERQVVQQKKMAEARTLQRAGETPELL